MAHTRPLYVLQLYIAGATRNSMVAVTNIKKICDTQLANNYTLDIIDVHQQPELARSENIIAAPTLIRVEPKPLRRLVGNLSDTEKVMRALGVDI